MNYIIVETQTVGGNTTVLTMVKPDFYQAEQQYHSTLSFAAVSQVDIHSVAMLTERGNLVKHECYVHEEPAAEPEE